MDRFFGLIREHALEYVRLQAWLNSVPDKTENPRRAGYKGSELLSVEPHELCNWLINYANECGLSSNGTPINWTEIHNWQEVTNNKDPWLGLVIRELSMNYFDELHLARDPARPAPIEDGDKSHRETVSNQFYNFIRDKS